MRTPGVREDTEMKKCLLIAWMVFLAQVVLAQTPPVITPPEELRASGVIDLLSDKLKETRGCVLTTWAGKPGGGIYLPIWTWHDMDGTPLIEFPAIGYRAVQGSRPDAFAPVTANLPGLSRKWFGSTWFKNHVTKSKFPPMFFGPALMVPVDYPVIRALRWEDWQKHMACVLSVRY